jgi:acyl-CoA dehydrogenase
MAITDPDVPVYQGASMFLVPTDTPGVNIVRNVGLGGESEGEGAHAYVRYENVRVPADNLLGGEGQAFVIAQTRLGGGRIHHAMRSIGVAQRAFDMMCERALSRQTQGEVLAKKQMVQDAIAESWIQLLQFRLQVLHAAWTIDQVGGHKSRTEIAGVKVATPKVMHDVVYRAMHIHGALGVSNEMPFAGMWLAAPIMGIADGPTEVHKVTIARQVLKRYQPYEGLFPPSHLPERRAEARARFAHLLDLEVGNL